MVGNEYLKKIYSGKTVLVTGHTGFKGSWLSLWLDQLGAEVVGYSDKVPTAPSHHEILELDLKSIAGDVRNLELLTKTVEDIKPDVVFHLAAQPLVRYSYKNPIETYDTNVMGSLKLYEACRKVDSIRAIVSITTDKVYYNKEWNYGYRENDTLGGYDPYSSSKSCMEIMTASIRNSYFNLNEYGRSHQTLISTVRAGNVIGGGDWACDRLIPDLVRSVIKNETVSIRSPKAVRPWQHVLEPLYGYLLVGARLVSGEKEFASAFNFGPISRADITVQDICQRFSNVWSGFKFEIDEDHAKNSHETKFLQLDSSKALAQLAWKPVWDDDPFSKTFLWYREYYENGKTISNNQLSDYIKAISA